MRARYSLSGLSHTRVNRASRRIALLPWGNVIEDFLDTARITLDEFSRDFVGSWMFGYVEALRHTGVETSIVCWSKNTRRPLERRHGATGARIVVLPATSLYRALAPRLRNPYGRGVADVFGPVPRPLRRALVPAREALLYLPTSPIGLGRTLRHYRFEAVLCQEYEFPRFDLAVAVGRVLRVPVFGVFQGGDYQRSRLEQFTRPPAMRAARGFIVPTRGEAARIQATYGVESDRIASIPNPIDTDEWRPEDRGAARDALGIPRDAQVVGWHGRVSINKKGLDVLVDALASLRERATSEDTRLLLVGSGHDDARLRTALGALDGGVHWVNRLVDDRAELRGLLAAADVYAFPSRHEGFAVAVVEAMACGLPVVAADASGVREALGTDASESIVPVGDAAALARSLALLLEAPDQAAAVGRAARERAVAEFSSTATGPRLRDFVLPDPVAD
jgi:starch synthase